MNGNLVALPGAAWNTQTVSAVATYAVANPLALTSVANIAAIPVGARISGSGVGREVYVTAKNVAASTITLSRPLWAAAGTRTFTFDRYAYMLDFSGFTELTRFQIKEVEFSCAGIASGINLATAGAIFDVFGMHVRAGEGPRHHLNWRGLSGSAHRPLPVLLGRSGASWRRTAAQSCSTPMPMTSRSATTARRGSGILAWWRGRTGSSVGNHFFGGDDATNGIRRAGVVLTLPNSKTFFTGNYIDNSFIELSNEHDATPDYSNEYSFGGLSA